MGNICEKRFKDIWASEEYWEVVNLLASPEFNAQTMRGTLCLQHKMNEMLDSYQKGQISLPDLSGQARPMHINFV